MSGPKHPEWEPDVNPEERDSAEESGDELDSGSDSIPELGPLDEHVEVLPADTSATDVYSRAYSAPESEHFTTVRYLPDVYDYDDEANEEHGAPRWPWVVGVVAIVAAVALVVSVSLLFMHTDSNNLANPGTTTSAPPFQDQITTTKPPPPSSSPPPPPTTEPPTATETQTVTVTPPPSPAPSPPATAPSAPPAGPSAGAAPPPATSATPAGPRQVTYTVTGTKAPGDIISVTYVDAAGHRRTQHNVYIPWSITVTPISTSDVGSVEASSLFRVSRLNCSITTSDGTVLSANSSDAAQTNC
jgi:hypothetical protein